MIRFFFVLGIFAAIFLVFYIGYIVGKNSKSKELLSKDDYNNILRQLPTPITETDKKLELKIIELQGL